MTRAAAALALLLLPAVGHAGGDEVTLRYDHTPGVRLVYEFTAKTVSGKSGDLIETTIRATVEYEILSDSDPKSGRSLVRCRIESLEVEELAPVLRPAVPDLKALPCEGKLGPDTMTAAVVVPKGSTGPVRGLATAVNVFIGVSAYGWARLPEHAVRLGDRWGPGVDGHGDGSRLVYTFSRLDRGEAAIELLDDRDTAKKHVHDEGRYTFDTAAGRWLSTSATTAVEDSKTGWGVHTKIEAHLVSAR